MQMKKINVFALQLPFEKKLLCQVLKKLDFSTSPNAKTVGGQHNDV